MNIRLAKLLAILALIFVGSSAFADPLVTYIIIPREKPKLVKIGHGKPLFKYPNEHPAYIVTYTEQDLLRMREEKFVKELENASFIRRMDTGIPNLDSSVQ